MRAATKRELMSPGQWTFTPLAILRADISDGAKACYQALGSFLRSGRESQCSPTETLIGETYGKTTRTVRRHVAELRDAGFIATKQSRGRPTTYVFLKPELEGQQDMFDGEPRTELTGVDGEPRTELTGVEGEPRTELTGVEGEPRTELTGVVRTVLSGVSAGVPYPPLAPEGGLIPTTVAKKAAADSTPTKLEPRREPPEAEDRSDVVAAAFLRQHFSPKTTRKLLTKHKAGAVLYVARQIAVRQKSPKNPPGLIRHLLGEAGDANPAEVAAAASEMTHQALKLELEEQEHAERAEHGRRRHQAAKQSLQAWLDAQADRAELITRAKAHAHFTCGDKANLATVRTAVTGFLWKERKAREHSPAAVYC